MGEYIDGVWAGEVLSDKFISRSGGWVSETGDRFKAVSVVKTALDSGVYSFDKTDQGLFFVTQPFRSDVPARLPGLPCDIILDQIELFWTKEEIYKKHGFVHKRGILLYGEPGCGKTSIIRLLANQIIERGGIVFSIDDFELASQAVTAFRKVEKTRPILTIQEDIEGLFDGSAGNDQVKSALSFLDGQDQVDNIVHIATTNQPEKIADRFIRRPGRFDLVIGIKKPLPETREAYLRHVTNNTIPEEKLKEIVLKSEGFPMSYLREIASTNICLGINLDDTIARLKHNKKAQFKNTESDLGFVIGYEGK